MLISGIHTKEKFDSDLNLLSLNEQWVEWDVSYLQVMEYKYHFRGVSITVSLGTKGQIVQNGISRSKKAAAHLSVLICVCVCEYHGGILMNILFYSQLTTDILYFLCNGY